MSMKYFIKTFGCQMNKADSERIAGDYEARGFRRAKNWKEADEIVINTCSVRQSAEDRVQGFLKNVTDYFDAVVPRQSSGHPVRIGPKIILTGCMTYHGEQELKKILPEIDVILPVGEIGFNQIPVRKDKIHAWIPISTGCNSFCSYCVVPYARGREKSRPLKETISEVEGLARQGYSHVTLLGQNVNSYGLDRVKIGLRKHLVHKNFTRTQKLLSPFVKLLQEISKIKNIKKISFMTSNPWDFSDQLINEIVKNKKIDRFIHLPVQSGSNRILKLMNRGYTREHYLRIVNKLKKAVPNVQIGTDIIVGFPTEGEKDFQDTLDLAKKVNWIVAFVARYSPRPGTTAWKLYKDDVPAKEKKRRWEILDEFINKKNLAKRPEFK